MVKDFIMRIKNPKENKDGAIDIEMEHPVYGWIPFTASADDIEEHGRALFAEAKAGKFGKPVKFKQENNNV